MRQLVVHPALIIDKLMTGLSYDPASQVTNILHQLTATSTPINQADYVYNPVGNRTSLTDRRGAQAFGYDNLDRLTSASHPLLATPQAFAYDPVGNRTTGGSVVNAGNQLTADANYAYQYDDNGNLTRKTLLATGNFTQYSYDAENRLTKVEEFAAGNATAFATSTYRYDGLGRRIEKVANGQTKRYIYDGEDILLEYDGTNALVARYTHGPGIDEPIAVTKGGATYFYHQDGLGSVTDLTDSTGATAKSYSYDAYGTILESLGTLEQPYTYTGREFDGESGLYYYRARNYDSASGRFLQEDPIELAGGTNFYRYSYNNPTNWSDPLGLLSWQDAQGRGMTWDQWWNHPETTMQDQIDAETIEPNPGIDPVDVGTGGFACWQLFKKGSEIPFGKNWRVAPFGNRTGHPLGRWPHYHRRGTPGPDGKTPPGQGIGRHRPIEKKGCDTGFCDRF